MAIRVTAAEVKAVDRPVFGSIADADMDGYIETANIMIDTVQINGTTISAATCHSSDSLDQLEKYLSAHIAYLSGGALSSEKIGDGQESRRNPTVLFKDLDSTFWGQLAVSLDCSGLLKKLGKEKVTFQPFGTA